MTDLDDLRQRLLTTPPGPIADDGTIAELLIRAWDEFAGSGAHSTTADKLIGRMEELGWEPPCLTFRIERHGATVLGSARAELHGWTVDVEARTATCGECGFRNVRPLQPRLDVRPLVDEIVTAIQTGRDHDGVRALPGNMTRVLVGKVIPAKGPRQTTAGRRKRFRLLLERQLSEVGWVPAAGRAPYTYCRSTKGSDS